MWHSLISSDNRWIYCLLVSNLWRIWWEITRQLGRKIMGKLFNLPLATASQPAAHAAHNRQYWHNIKRDFSCHFFLSLRSLSSILSPSPPDSVSHSLAVAYIFTLLKNIMIATQSSILNEQTKHKHKHKQEDETVKVFQQCGLSNGKVLYGNCIWGICIFTFQIFCHFTQANIEYTIISASIRFDLIWFASLQYCFGLVVRRFNTLCQCTQWKLENQCGSNSVTSNISMGRDVSIFSLEFRTNMRKLRIHTGCGKICAEIKIVRNFGDTISQRFGLSGGTYAEHFSKFVIKFGENSGILINKNPINILRIYDAT